MSVKNNHDLIKRTWGYKRDWASFKCFEEAKLIALDNRKWGSEKGKYGWESSFYKFGKGLEAWNLENKEERVW